MTFIWGKMATILAIAVGSFGAVGICLLIKKYQADFFKNVDSSYKGTGSEKQQLLLNPNFSPNRKEIQAEKRRIYEEEALSIIYEASEAGTMLSSRVNSEDAIMGQTEFRTSNSVTPRSQMLFEEDDDIDEIELRSLEAAVPSSEDREDNDNTIPYTGEIAHKTVSTSTMAIQNVSSTQEKKEISLYEASKSQIKTEVSSDSFTLFVDKDISEPKRRVVHNSLKYAFVVENVLSSLECEEFIKRTEAIGFSKWTDDEARLAFRDCDTIEINHPELSELLWNRIRKVMTSSELDCFIDRECDPERWQRDIEGQWVAGGTVNSILFSRYLEGGHFAIHTDGFNVENFDRRSLFSIVLYLNDVPNGDGGETIFFSNDAKDKMEKDDKGRIVGDPQYVVAKVSPVAGTAAVFFHNILHQSEPIRLGSNSRKYIIRSDVMYSRTPPVITEERDREAFSMYQKAEALSDSDPEESARLFRLAFKRSAVLSRIYGM
jgi:hypothetical protein